MLPVANKPALEHLLLALRDNGIRDISIVVGYRSQMIEDYFGTGERWDLLLTYLRQDRPLGTAHALGLARKYVDDDYFLLIYGDLFIHPSSLQNLIQEHLKSGEASLAVVPVQNAEQFGIIHLKDGLVKGIIEKPDSSRYGNLANAGMYILPKDIFTEISKTQISPRAEFEITDTLQLLVEKGVPIISAEMDPDNWLDLGRPWDLLEANERALKHSKLYVKGEVEPGAVLVGEIGIEEGARIRSGAYLEGPILIGRGSDIGPNCYIRPFTSIGRDVRIGNACEVKASLIFDRSHIGHLSYIGDSIVGEQSNLGANTVTANLRFDNDTVKVMIKSVPVDSGRRKLGAIIGDNVKTGIGVNIMPGIKLGSNSWIGPGVTVYKNVDQGVFVVQKQNLDVYRSMKTNR